MSDPVPSSALPVRVLVADDELALREAYRNILLPKQPAASAQDGFAGMRSRLFGSSPPSGPSADIALECCNDARSAVAAVQDAVAAGEPFAIVFLDVRMPPGPDGVWAATEIRALDPNIEIVIVTAYSDLDPSEIAHRVLPVDKLLYLQKPFHPHEISHCVASLGAKWRSMHQLRAITERRIHQLAYYDQLTNLPNRTYLNEQLVRELHHARRHGRQVGLLYLDLDNFKRINDTFGHSAGDEVLREAARRLVESLRESDYVARGARAEQLECSSDRRDNTIARLGGDEFIVILSEIANAHAPARVAERIGVAFNAPLRINDCDIPLSASIGITLFPEDGEDEETLLKNADAAMYHAKSSGRGAYQFYTHELNVAALERLSLEAELRQALERDELVLHFQPKNQLATGAVVGAEALVRWQHPERGLLFPGEFIGLAEESGLIVPLGNWVLRSACRQIREWAEAGHSQINVSINVSFRQLHDVQFVANVQKTLQEMGIVPSQLELEFTESILMDDAQAADRIIGELKALGLHISMDDFGTGYSSLSYLKRLPLDYVKIDGSFVKDLMTSHQDRAIVTAVISMVHELGFQVVAEGVETSEQAHFLKRLGCDLMQGYLVSRAVLEDEFTAKFLGAYEFTYPELYAI